MKDIVYIAYNAWDSAWRGDQQISAQFAKFCRVIYCNPPRWLWDEGASALRPALKTPAFKSLNNLFIVNSLFWLPFSRSCKTFTRYNFKLFVNKLLKKIQSNNPILWINAPIPIEMFNVLVKRLQPSLICFRWADDWSEFPNTPTSKQNIINNCEHLILSSDIVFTVSQRLFDKALKYKTENVYLLPNAVNNEILEKILSKDNYPTKIDNLTGPIFCYIGTINRRINFDWLDKASLENPNWNFVFIGPFSKSFCLPEQLKNNEKIIFLGEVGYEDLPGYFRKANAFLLLHHKTEATLAMDPIKLYEYLFTGKPIIATRVIDQKFEKYVYFSDTYEEFIINCKKSLIENDKVLSSERHNLAIENTWGSRLVEIKKVIENHVKLSGLV